MEITNEQLPWDSEDSAIFAGFLQTVSGRRLIPKLLENAPTLLQGGPTNEIMIRSGELRGFSDAVRSLLSLQTVIPEQKPDPTAYPSLEDDAAFNDGQTLNK